MMIEVFPALIIVVLLTVTVTKRSQKKSSSRQAKARSQSKQRKKREVSSKTAVRSRRSTGKMKASRVRAASARSDDESATGDAGTEMTSRSRRNAARNAAKEAAAAAAAAAPKSQSTGRRDKQVKKASAVSTTKTDSRSTTKAVATKGRKPKAAAAAAAAPNIKSTFIDFALSFFRTAADPKADYVLSPFSLGTGLALVMDGGRGRTQEEIVSLLGKNGSIDEVRAFYREQVGALSKYERKKQTPVNCKTLTALFTNKELDLEKDFVAQVSSDYAAHVQHMDFKNKSACARRVNDFVELNTNGIIQNIVSSQDFGVLTGALLINTVSFAGAWMKQFTSARSGKFHGMHGDREEKFMSQQFMNVDFFIDSNLSAVCLPYEDPAYTMLALMPSGNFTQWLAKLDGEAVRCAMAKMEKNRVNLRMPTIKMESNVDVNGALAKLGVGTCFDPTAADLSRMSNTGDLYVGSILQKAAIELDEGGTRAAAATSVRCPILCTMPEITLAQPFLFFILRDGVPLFVGKHC